MAEDLEAAFASGELPGELRDDDVKLGGEGGEIGGGEGEEGGEGFGVGVEEAAVGVLVLFVNRGVEDGLGLVEPGEGLSPFVIPAKAGIHEHGRIRFSTDRVHGFRVKPGMTNNRNGADSA